jgi:hypothetical protein
MSSLFLLYSLQLFILSSHLFHLSDPLFLFQPLPLPLLPLLFIHHLINRRLQRSSPLFNVRGYSHISALDFVNKRLKRLGGVVEKENMVAGASDVSVFFETRNFSLDLGFINIG